MLPRVLGLRPVHFMQDSGSSSTNVLSLPSAFPPRAELRSAGDLQQHF
jgi:hypothetical protein